MGNLVLTIGRLFLLMFLTLGLGCYFWPESMMFIPQSWKEGLVIALLPCSLALFTDISFSIIQAILKEKKENHAIDQFAKSAITILILFLLWGIWIYFLYLHLVQTQT